MQAIPEKWSHAGPGGTLRQRALEGEQEGTLLQVISCQFSQELCYVCYNLEGHAFNLYPYCSLIKERKQITLSGKAKLFQNRMKNKLFSLLGI